MAKTTIEPQLKLICSFCSMTVENLELGLHRAVRTGPLDFDWSRVLAVTSPDNQHHLTVRLQQTYLIFAYEFKPTTLRKTSWVHFWLCSPCVSRVMTWGCVQMQRVCAVQIALCLNFRCSAPSRACITLQIMAPYPTPPVKPLQEAE
jgi:hypothetical protein